MCERDPPLQSKVIRVHEQCRKNSVVADGDGIDDLVIGAPTADPNGETSGSSYVVSGNAAPQSDGLPAEIAAILGDAANPVGSLPVNDAPALSASALAPIPFDAGKQTVPNWAAFDPGPNNECAQTATWIVSDIADPALFAVAPSVSAWHESRSFCE